MISKLSSILIVYVLMPVVTVERWYGESQSKKENKAKENEKEE